MTNTPPRAALRAVVHDLAEAEVAKIARVVAMVDALPSRGAADEVIAPLRPRLLALRPPRPLRLGRLLFLPLDAVIVPAANWRRGSPAIPRSVLPTIALHLSRLAAREVAEVEAVAAGATTADSGRLLAAGRMLWPMAARELMQASAPADWTVETGLQPADFAMIAANIATVLHCAAEVQTLAASGADPQPALGAILTEAAQRRPAQLPTLLAALLALWPDCTWLIALTERLAAQQGLAGLRGATDGALDLALATIEAAPALPPDMVVAEQDLKRAISLIEACDGRTAQTAERRERLRDLRKRYEQEARSCFDTALASGIMDPVAGIAGADDAAVVAMEHRARDLRRFEATARRVGTRTHYDQTLRDAAERLRPAGDATPAARSDRLRLVEILAGAEVALAMLADRGAG